MIDGEAIACENGLSVFKLIRGWRHDHAVTLCAFDLLKLNGEDLRRILRYRLPRSNAAYVSISADRHKGAMVPTHF